MPPQPSSTIPSDLHSPLSAPSVLLAPPRLRSPIQLPESALRTASTKSTFARRRSKPSSVSPHRRRTSQPEPAPHPFDQLLWTSVLDSAPDYTNPWDIADLSQLPLDHITPSSSSASGPGPVRRRKTSLRSNPLASHLQDAWSESTSHPLRDSSASFSSSLRTPRSKFDPSRVLFQHLMPVSYDSHKDESGGRGYASIER